MKCKHLILVLLPLLLFCFIVGCNEEDEKPKVPAKLPKKPDIGFEASKIKIKIKIYRIASCEAKAIGAYASSHMESTIEGYADCDLRGFSWEDDRFISGKGFVTSEWTTSIKGSGEEGSGSSETEGNCVESFTVKGELELGDKVPLHVELTNFKREDCNMKGTLCKDGHCIDFPSLAEQSKPGKPRLITFPEFRDGCQVTKVQTEPEIHQRSPECPSTEFKTQTTYTLHIIK